MRETIYWIKRRITNTGRTVLYTLMPNWLVRESMMYASRYICPDEVIPEVTFMDVFERVCKEKKQ